MEKNKKKEAQREISVGSKTRMKTQSQKHKDSWYILSAGFDAAFLSQLVLK